MGMLDPPPNTDVGPQGQEAQLAGSATFLRTVHRMGGSRVACSSATLAEPGSWVALSSAAPGSPLESQSHCFEQGGQGHLHSVSHPMVAGAAGLVRGVPREALPKQQPL